MKRPLFGAPMSKKFTYLELSKVEKKYPENDYLMTLNLSQEEVTERFGIEFTKDETDTVRDVWFACIQLDSLSYVYQFRYEKTDSAKRTSLYVRGRDIDLREAYSKFSQAINIPAKDIFWMSDSL